MGGVLTYLLLFDSMGSHLSSLACEYEGFPCSSVQSTLRENVTLKFHIHLWVVWCLLGVFFWLRFSYKTIPLDGLYFLQWSDFFLDFFIYFFSLFIGGRGGELLFTF